MYPRDGWAGEADRVPGLSRRSFIRATGSAGLLGGLGALLAACSNTTASRYFPGHGSSSFPDASTTGPAASGYTSLNPVSITATTGIQGAGNQAWVQTRGDGSLLIEGQEFTWAGGGNPQGYMIDVSTTKKVTFRGCKFKMDGLAAGVHLMFQAASEWHVEYCEFASNGSGHYHAAIGSQAGPGTIDHCNMHEWAQAVHLQPGSAGSVLTSNYVHSPGYIETDHTDGVYLWDGVNNITFEHNTILNDLSQTDCIYRGPRGNSDSTYYRHNLFAGGTYALYGAGQVGAATTNMVIENNWFSTRYYPNCGYAGPATYMPRWGSNGNVWDNNRWYDGPNVGKPVGMRGTG